MTILVTGATGTIGSKVVTELAARGAKIRALSRSPEKVTFPQGVTAVTGDLLDLDSMRAALDGADTLFLLVANAPDELTKAMITLNLARDAGVKGIVYLSVFKSVEFGDVPHFAGKGTVEQMIEQDDLPATILRPAYFIQNDLAQKDALLAGVYGMPVGQRGISMVDTRDIAQAAAIELIRRDSATGPLPREVYELVGPDALTGPKLAEIWSETLGRSVSYGGDDLDRLEARIKAFAPGWLAYDMRQMMRRYQQDGAVATDGDLERFATLLGHQPRSYRDFAREAARTFAA
jgi:uncharacterized protein YbjT (DUF2867 family)